MKGIAPALLYTACKEHEHRKGGEPLDCRIRVTSHLDPSWQTWLADLQIIHEPEGTTLLVGPLLDQAALYGVLLTIRRLGLRLLSLETNEPQAKQKEFFMPNQITYEQTSKDQRIIILGGTSGLGLATAQLAAAEGASLVVASHQQTSVERALTLLPAGTEGYTLDLSREEAVKGFFEEIGAFDHLIFTAGDSLLMGNLSETDMEQARHFFNLRYWGAVLAIKYGSSHIRPGGSIVLTSGARPSKGLSVVASVLGAVEALARALAVELAPIRVNVICPGVIRTELWKTMPEEAREDFFQSTGQKLPVGRVGSAAEIARSYLYVMHQGFTTGQILVADGGAALATLV